MTLNAEEKLLLEELFPKRFTEPDDFRDHLPPEIFDFLSLKGAFRTISDRLIFYEKNQWRSQDSATITFFITKNDNFVEKYTELINGLTGPALLFLDFHYILEGIDENENEKYISKYKLQTASKASSVNQFYKLVKEKDFENAIKEFSDFTATEFLNRAFLCHSNLYEFSNSGLRPVSLLCAVLFISKF